jgi:Meiotically up-regulated gene 113
MTSRTAKAPSTDEPLSDQLGTIYLIRSLLIDGHKIGITQNWSRRSRELDVGAKATEVLVETVPLPKALELALHRRFRKERIPQSEYFALSAAQTEEVKALITQEAAKLRGDQADLHITLARLVYEQDSLPAAQAVGHAIKIDQLKRQLDPEYRAEAERREAQALAEKQRRDLEHAERAALVLEIEALDREIHLINEALLDKKAEAVVRNPWRADDAGEAIAASLGCLVAGLALSVVASPFVCSAGPGNKSCVEEVWGTGAGFGLAFGLPFGLLTAAKERLAARGQQQAKAEPPVCPVYPVQPAEAGIRFRESITL